MKCTQAKQLFSPMLDSMLEGREIHALNRHVSECESCATEYAALRRTKWLITSMQPRLAPPERDETGLPVRSRALEARFHSVHRPGRPGSDKLASSG